MRPITGLLDLLQQVVCMCNKGKHVCDNNKNPDNMPRAKTQATKTTQPKSAPTKPVAFTVTLDEGSGKKGKLPPRFQHKTEGRPMTPDFVVKKQEDAEARRREYQDIKLQKIKEKTGEVKRINKQPSPQAV